MRYLPLCDCARLLLKAHVPGHQQHIAGKLVLVRPYETKAPARRDERQADLFAPHPAVRAPESHAPPALLFKPPASPSPAAAGAPDLASYDNFLVGFSGGKDSIAAVLSLLKAGVPREKIELWHHDVDGDGRNLMDWPITKGYCRAVAEALGLPIYFSQRDGGIEREMLRDQTPTASVTFETPEGVTRTVGGHSDKVTTRLQFPQTGSIASGRWCSGKVKIEVMEAAIRNQPRFDGKRTLVVTGERAEESNSRSHYETFKPHKVSTRGRHVDHYLPVHGQKEAEVWESVKAAGIVPHPAYQLGYSRLSCRNCIFADKDQWATNRKFYPDSVAPIRDYEKQFNKTIHRSESVDTRADKGTPYAAAAANPALVALADQHTWSGPIQVRPEEWEMPAGAFKHGGGPT